MLFRSRNRWSGLLVPPEDPQALAGALYHLCRSERLRQRLGQAARKDFHERFELSRMVDAYERLFGLERRRTSSLCAWWTKASIC